MRLDRFGYYAWLVLAYNLAVIVWGAYVRATGSGAGCGSHWPLCNGEAVPRSAQAETMIEFAHRATSGIALIAVVALFLWSRRQFPSGHVVRAGAAASLALIIVEALLGAGLVLFELVADDDSYFRAVSMVAHLINTFLLIAALTLTAWWASGGRAPRRANFQGAPIRLVAAALVGLLLVGATGAIAALGDTLFPSDSLGEGLRNSFSPDSHPLVQLRKYHPLIAIVIGLVVVGAARRAARSAAGTAARNLAVAVTGLYLVQLLAGATNMILLAPVELQLVHLLLADLVWISVVLLGAAIVGDVGDRDSGVMSRGGGADRAVPVAGSS